VRYAGTGEKGDFAKIVGEVDYVCTRRTSTGVPNANELRRTCMPFNFVGGLRLLIRKQQNSRRVIS
jgi:hypothetical protein